MGHMGDEPLRSDQENQGYLDLQGFRRLCSDLGHPVLSEESAQAMARLDATLGDGTKMYQASLRTLIFAYISYMVPQLFTKKAARC